MLYKIANDTLFVKSISKNLLLIFFFFFLPSRGIPGQKPTVVTTYKINCAFVKEPGY